MNPITTKFKVQECDIKVYNVELMPGRSFPFAGDASIAIGPSFVMDRVPVVATETGLGIDVTAVWVRGLFEVSSNVPLIRLIDKVVTEEFAMVMGLALVAVEA